LCAAFARDPGAEVVGYMLADLASILLMGQLIGGVFVRLRPPGVVGKMIAGILIGPTVLGGRLTAGLSAAGRRRSRGLG
jgi:Kef-type K+ transport system membrane component KefB